MTLTEMIPIITRRNYYNHTIFSPEIFSHSYYQKVYHFLKHKCKHDVLYYIFTNHICKISVQLLDHPGIMMIFLTNIHYTDDINTFFSFYSAAEQRKLIIYNYNLISLALQYNHIKIIIFIIFYLLYNNITIDTSYFVAHNYLSRYNINLLIENNSIIIFRKSLRYAWHHNVIIE